MITHWTGEQFEDAEAYEALHGGVAFAVECRLLADDLTVPEEVICLRLRLTLHYALQELMAVWYAAQLPTDTKRESE